MRSRLIAALFFVFICLPLPEGGSAHPLGNFSISQYSAIRLRQMKLSSSVTSSTWLRSRLFRRSRKVGLCRRPEIPSLKTYLERKSGDCCAMV